MAPVSPASAEGLNISAAQTVARQDCPECGAGLVCHLPDPDLPERLIGACLECKNWFLLELFPDGSLVLSLIPAHHLLPGAGHDQDELAFESDD